ncbi:hypothetical protein EYC84_000411 [Monilinia fructicola]|uniref:Uncharacterized protein n=1 Tax=Monilinia fructicola TaxID=38448 RepID=A0A5M9JQS7_MONFR|nr:hypothetical protein EYC84_000411 [Monilinia fructicola]
MRKINPISAARPNKDPITIPAIAPPDSPVFDAELVAAPEEDAVGLAVPELDAVLVEKMMNPVIVGNTTPAQRVSAPEL